MMTRTKVSVIVPIYNVQRFIENCARSLFEQTLEEVEFIFVDDATPDKSMDILRLIVMQYPKRMQQIKILEHKNNQGLPAARNTGLKVARGEYIFHCDSDDYLSSNALESMYETAKKQDADIVWCDWYLSFKKSERYMKQPYYDAPINALKGMLAGAMKYNVWNKLVRRNLYEQNSIYFPAGYGMGEDMTMIHLFVYAKKVCYLPKAFYHYVRFNAEGFTQIGRGVDERKLTDLQYNVQRTISFIRNHFGSQLDKELAYFQLETKFPFLITDDKNSYQRWREWFPEANRYIWYNKQLSFRSRLLQYMAANGQFWYVWLYYKLVIKLVYGVFYN